MREFRSFAAVMRQYVEATRADQMLHRNVVSAAHGLVDYLQSERKRVPGEVLLEAERLECLLFLGYDPHFEGDGPPGARALLEELQIEAEQIIES